LDGRDEDIWREAKSRSAATIHYLRASSRIGDYELKVRIGFKPKRSAKHLPRNLLISCTGVTRSRQLYYVY
jgi:hypothetical protein